MAHACVSYRDELEIILSVAVLYCSVCSCFLSSMWRLLSLKATFFSLL